MLRRGFPIACLGILLHAAAGDAPAQQLYTAARLPGFAPAINNAGDAAGTASSTPPFLRAFRWSQGTASDLGSLGQAGSRAYGINDNGDVVGDSDVPVPGRTFSNVHAFVHSEGGMRDLGTLGGANSTAVAINQGGQIAGTAETGFGRRHAFRHSQGRMLDLGTLDGFASTAMDINRAGDVVGESGGHAFLYRDGMRDLGAPLGYSIARAVNDAGQVVGLSGRSDIDGHAFLHADGQMHDLGTLGGAFSAAFDINNHGDIVGWTDVAGHDGRLAFLYSEGEMRTLDSMLYGTSAVSFGMAFAINDVGQILASGCGAGACASYLLTPIPEPAGYLMLGTGLGLILLLRRRQPRGLWPMRRQTWRCSCAG
ncbi:PEP-CTERM sorting domain-containing protein [Massilia niastensis]|uniref:PEP-CTERM sorting domain-containing protein n=1 Tax=Massilia niastensis TaxID=544911 RepID=UPI0003647DD0|nr:PEP-CTERM sorting domain-containing protein [Massilia niastensis]